jgi:hypothetical protein
MDKEKIEGLSWILIIVEGAVQVMNSVRVVA